MCSIIHCELPGGQQPCPSVGKRAKAYSKEPQSTRVHSLEGYFEEGAAAIGGCAHVSFKSDQLNFFRIKECREVGDPENRA